MPTRRDDGRAEVTDVSAPTRTEVEVMARRNGGRAGTTSAATRTRTEAGVSTRLGGERVVASADGAMPTRTKAKAAAMSGGERTMAGDTTPPVRKKAKRAASPPRGRKVSTAPRQSKTRVVPSPGDDNEQAVHRVGPIFGGDGESTASATVEMNGQRQAAVDEQIRRRAHEPTLQLTDTEITSAQAKSRLVQRLLEAGMHRGMKVERRHGLVLIKTTKGRRVILPPELWAVAFKEHHDSVWAGHLRAPHTYARIAQVYWWPDLQQQVRRWVRGCQECGSRKARPREVVPPLRSLRGGEVGDRWALDVAGPLPTSDGGQRYVIAAVECVTRYAVATTVQQHTADKVAEFLMRHVVLKFGPFRELLTDGAPELTGKAIERLVVLLQAQQTNPVPYRLQMVGLVERFHRTWKDWVSTYMNDDRQHDWDTWVDFAVYAYNSAQHSTVKPERAHDGQATAQPERAVTLHERGRSWRVERVPSATTGGDVQ
ncbi:hypothetical protein PF007_g7016 [Phytophthora fragariae]|uniref:Integrase catalytic domain-containing protein n=1 Tax=Phytophthora fragariae TaxID=53985 RepID=A0A6A3SZE7_9STRA|nr:hypothetical protein PF007_g7016 [Phytophthora fragariae]